jgi:hypothetical protein
VLYWILSTPLVAFTHRWALVIPVVLALAEIVGLSFFIAIFTWTWPVRDRYTYQDFPDLDGVAGPATVAAEGVVALVHNGLLWSLLARGLIVRRNIAYMRVKEEKSYLDAKLSLVISRDSQMTLRDDLAFGHKEMDAPFDPKSLYSTSGNQFL